MFPETEAGTAPVLGGLLRDAAKKSSSSSSSSKRPADAGTYKLFPGGGCSGFWGSFSDGADAAPNTSVSPVGGRTGQTSCEPVWMGFLTSQEKTKNKKQQYHHQELVVSIHPQTH